MLETAVLGWNIAHGNGLPAPCNKSSVFHIRLICRIGPHSNAKCAHFLWLAFAKERISITLSTGYWSSYFLCFSGVAVVVWSHTGSSCASWDDGHANGLTTAWSGVAGILGTDSDLGSATVELHCGFVNWTSALIALSSCGGIRGGISSDCWSAMHLHWFEKRSNRGIRGLKEFNWNIIFEKVTL